MAEVRGSSHSLLDSTSNQRTTTVACRRAVAPPTVPARSRLWYSRHSNGCYKTKRDQDFRRAILLIFNRRNKTRLFLLPSEGASDPRRQRQSIARRPYVRLLFRCKLRALNSARSIAQWHTQALEAARFSLTCSQTVRQSGAASAMARGGRAASNITRKMLVIELVACCFRTIQSIVE